MTDFTKAARPAVVISFPFQVGKFPLRQENQTKGASPTVSQSKKKEMERELAYE
jgi:hypothetical protein